MPAPVSLTEKLRKLEAIHLDSLALCGAAYRRGGYIRIRAKCAVCGEEREYLADNLLKRKTTRCRCRRKVKYRRDPFAEVFGERFDAIKQRCEKPTNDSFHNYGGRGIEYRFENREEFVRYMLTLCRESYPDIRTAEELRTHDIDRTDNEGHYAPGNLGLVSRSQNASNTRRTRFTRYNGLEVVASHLWDLLKNEVPDLPFSREWVTKLAKQGFSGEQILTRSIDGKRQSGRPVTRPQWVSVATLSIYGIHRKRRRANA